jgi:hypothetical protein
LLDEIAAAGKGSFSFVPDSGMVGTAFANLIANNFCIYATNAKLSLDVMSPHTIEKVFGYSDQECALNVDRCKIPINTLYMQQPRAVTLKIIQTKLPLDYLITGASLEGLINLLAKAKEKSDTNIQKLREFSQCLEE